MSQPRPATVVLEPRPRLSRIGRWVLDGLTLLQRGPGRYPGGVDPIDATAGEPVVVTGWARIGDRAAEVLVFVDDVTAAVAEVEAHPGSVPHRGGRLFSATVTLPPGEHVVRAIAVERAGRVRRLVGRRTSVAEPVTPTPPRFRCLDRPLPDAHVPLPLVTLQGWTVDEPMARVVVEIDGERVPARAGAYARPDVAAEIDSVHARFSGFEATLDLTGRAPGDVLDVRVVVERPDGELLVVDERRLVVEPAPEAAEVDGWLLDWVRSRGATRATSHPLADPAAAPGVRAHHVLVVTHHLGIGGGQLYLQELLLGLLRTPGLRATVVSPIDGELRAELEAAGAAVRVVGHFPMDPIGYERMCGDLASLATEVGATAVLANTALAFVGVDAASRLGIPALWAIHESYDVEHLAVTAWGPGGVHPTVLDRLRAALASAAAVVFEAEETRRMYAHHGDERRFVHVPYGVPLDDLDRHRAAADREQLRADRGFGPDHVVLLCLGTIEERKLQAPLVRAFTQVADEFPEARLALVGDRGDLYGEALAAYVDDLGVADRVSLHPITPDSYDWYTASDAFVLVSDLESLPRSVLEAMGAELPVLATRVFGLADTIVDGDSGLLIEPRDLAAVADGLRRLLAMTPEARRAMGASASAHVRTEHDSAGYVRDYRRLLDGLAVDAGALPADCLAAATTTTTGVQP